MHMYFIGPTDETTAVQCQCNEILQQRFQFHQLFQHSNTLVPTCSKLLRLKYDVQLARTI